jgi:WhiB family transcriptional regulator, redox-sensing transcriptional regulator
VVKRFAKKAPPWMHHAACVGKPSGLFYPARGEVTAEARLICGECLVRQECLDYALREFETEGVWGGLSPDERQRFRRCRVPMS